MKRVGHGRWSKRKEAIFFEERAATNNVQRSAKAAGVSPNAVFARRLRHPLFRAKWEAVVQTAKASIDLYSVEASKQTFDPDSLDVGHVTPKVTIAEAIKIAQLNARAAERGAAAEPFAEEAATMSEEEVHELRERLLSKIGRLQERTERERLEQGWTRDDATGHIVPPGWARGE